MTDEEAPREPETTREDQLLRVWERAIQTQMHFAELSIKTRQTGLTVVGATLGLAIVLNRTGAGFFVQLASLKLPISSILCWVAALVLFAIRLLDVHVYHRMLRGAVAFNEDLEEANLLPLFGTSKGLTQAISFFSRHSNAKFSNGTYFPQPSAQRRLAGDRISTFYWLMIGALLIAGTALMFAGVQ